MPRARKEYVFEADDEGKWTLISGQRAARAGFGRGDARGLGNALRRKAKVEHLPQRAAPSSAGCLTS